MNDSRTISYFWNNNPHTPETIAGSVNKYLELMPDTVFVDNAGLRKAGLKNRAVTIGNLLDTEQYMKSLQEMQYRFGQKVGKWQGAYIVDGANSNVVNNRMSGMFGIASASSTVVKLDANVFKSYPLAKDWKFVGGDNIKRGYKPEIMDDNSIRFKFSADKNGYSTAVWHYTQVGLTRPLVVDKNTMISFEIWTDNQQTDDEIGFGILGNWPGGTGYSVGTYWTTKGGTNSHRIVSCNVFRVLGIIVYPDINPNPVLYLNCVYVVYRMPNAESQKTYECYLKDLSFYSNNWREEFKTGNPFRPISKAGSTQISLISGSSSEIGYFRFSSEYTRSAWWHLELGSSPILNEGTIAISIKYNEPMLRITFHARGIEKGTNKEKIVEFDPFYGQAGLYRNEWHDYTYHTVRIIDVYWCLKCINTILDTTKKIYLKAIDIGLYDHFDEKKYFTSYIDYIYVGQDMDLDGKENDNDNDIDGDTVENYYEVKFGQLGNIAKWDDKCSFIRGIGNVQYFYQSVEVLQIYEQVRMDPLKKDGYIDDLDNDGIPDHRDKYPLEYNRRLALVIGVTDFDWWAEWMTPDLPTYFPDAVRDTFINLGFQVTLVSGRVTFKDFCNAIDTFILNNKIVQSDIVTLFICTHGTNWGGYKIAFSDNIYPGDDFLGWKGLLPQIKK